MDNVQGVQVGHSLQDLSHHVAGVLLRVVALVQDPVKHFSPRGSADMGTFLAKVKDGQEDATVPSDRL